MLNSNQETAEKEWNTKLQKQRTKALNGKKDKNFTATTGMGQCGSRGNYRVPMLF